MKATNHAIAHSANAILWLWNRLLNDADMHEPDVTRRCWYKYDVRQAYQDALIVMKNCGLIEDYDVEKVRCKVAGEWTDARRCSVFVPTKKARSKKSKEVAYEVAHAGS